MPATKRRYTSRRQSEPQKRVQTSPGDSPAVEALPAVVDEPLPTKIGSGRPLPVTRSARTDAEHSLQTIAESGVLAASLERSRAAWLSSGLFEKYWTKPSTKKGQTEASNNPPKDSMARLGPCRITIEPHVFEVNLFTIKDAKPKQAAQQTAQPSAFPPPAPQTQKTSPLPNVLAAQAELLPPREDSSASAMSNTETVKAETTNPTLAPAQHQKQLPNQPVTPSTQVASASPATSSLASKAAGPDPVIQMLAQRASTNPELKGLMKIVASGSANSEQLRIFQTHIDELTAINQRQIAAREAQAKKTGTSSAVQSTASSTPVHITNTNLHAQHNVVSPYAMPKAGHGTAPVYRPPISAPPKPDVIGIAIEFAKNGDRFLFPKHTIMQYVSPGRQALVSFLIVRKRERNDGNRGKKKEEEVFQPVTLRLWSDSAKIFDTISRTLAPLAEVQRRMEEIMARAKRAEPLHLALQLPRESDPSGEDSGPATPSAVGKPSERRHSLLRSSITAASPGRSTPTKREKVNQFMEQHCMYCFDAVSTPAQKLEGKTVCHLCGTLRQRDLLLSGQPLHVSGRATRHASSAQALML